jgi:hypothetical protein
MVGAYELRQLLAARRDPKATARSAHSALRGVWVQVLSRQAGTEILAVQALRNSLMSATITASTAVLVLMSFISFIATRADAASSSMPEISARRVLELGLGASLFAAFACSAIAMRYYHHSGFVMSLPVGAPERAEREQLATVYVQRAGTLYSWSLRCFLFAAPIGTGLMHPYAMPVSALVLIVVLFYFDKVPGTADP